MDRQQNTPASSDHWNSDSRGTLRGSVGLLAIRQASKPNDRLLGAAFLVLGLMPIAGGILVGLPSALSGTAVLLMAPQLLAAALMLLAAYEGKTSASRIMCWRSI